MSLRAVVFGRKIKMSDFLTRLYLQVKEKKRKPSILKDKELWFVLGIKM